MKRLLLGLLVLAQGYAVAAAQTNESAPVTHTMAMSDMPGMNMSSMDMPNMMYMDFGIGIGTASNWSSSSLALDAMTMGIYATRNLGVEIGMGMLPNGVYQGSGAMNNTFHLAAKGILPLSNVFSLYGKLGVGVNAGMGSTMSMGMMNMHDMTMITPTNAGVFYGVGINFDLSKRFGLYVENSGVAIIPGGNSGFGNTNQTTFGLEVRI
jgi:hypothetical protein